MAKIGTKVYSKYFGNGTIVERIENDTIRVRFTGELPESNYKAWCNRVLFFNDKILSYQENDLRYYKNENNIAHTPQHRLKIINPKIKTIKE